MITLNRGEWRAGGGVVFGVACAGGVSITLYQYVSSLFVAAVTQEEGLTRGALSTLSAIGLMSFLAAPLLGMAADRFGVRAVAGTSNILMAASWALIAILPFDRVAFALLFGLATLFGLGAGGLVLMRAVIGWFERARGLALGAAASGVSVFAILAPPLFQHVISEHGWRGGVWILVALALCIGLPAIFFLVREKPVSTLTPQVRGHGLHLKDALRMPTTWLLMIAIGAVNFASTGILSQLAPLLTDKGFHPNVAAQLLSVYAASVMAGRFIVGISLDATTPHRVAWAATSASVLGCLLMLVPGASLPIALAAIALVGVQQGSESDLFAYFVARFCGVRAFSSVMGALYVSLGVSIAGGVLMFGRLFDLTHSYDLALRVSIGAFVLGAISLGLLGRYKPFSE